MSLYARIQGIPPPEGLKQTLWELSGSDIAIQGIYSFELAIVAVLFIGSA